MDSLPIFLTHGAPPCALRAREGSAKTIERMTCHCFLRPLSRDLTSSSYTTESKHELKTSNKLLAIGLTEFCKLFIVTYKSEWAVRHVVDIFSQELIFQHYIVFSATEI